MLGLFRGVSAEWNPDDATLSGYQGSCWARADYGLVRDWILVVNAFETLSVFHKNKVCIHTSHCAIGSLHFCS